MAATKDKNVVQLAFPIPKSVHKKLKVLAGSKELSLQGLILKMAEELFNKTENQELLNHIN